MFSEIGKFYKYATEDVTARCSNSNASILNFLETALVSVKMEPLEWRWATLCARESGKCYFSEMWQDLGSLGGVGVNSGAHQVDQFGTTGKRSVRIKFGIRSIRQVWGKPSASESFATAWRMRSCSSCTPYRKRCTRSKQNGTMLRKFFNATEIGAEFVPVPLQKDRVAALPIVGHFKILHLLRLQTD